MNRNNCILLFTFFLLIFSYGVGVSLAEEAASDAAAKEEEEETFADFKKGQVLSTSGNFNSAGINVKSAGTAGAVPGEDKVTPVSVSARRNGDQCIVIFTSNSEKSTFSVGVKVDIKDQASGRTRATRSVYASVKPKSTVERSFKCPEGNIATTLLKGSKK